MTNPRIFKVDGYEQLALPILARIYKSIPGTGRSIVTPSDVASIALSVRRFNLVNGGFGNLTETETDLARVPATVLFTTLQTDDGWTKDAIGYNFADTVPAAAFPGLGAYSLVWVFTPIGSFSIFPLIVRANVLSLQGTLTEG